MAQEIFEHEMVEGGDRPMLYDGGSIRVIKFDSMNYATVVFKDDVVSRRGDSKGTSRSKWEVNGFHGKLESAMSSALKHHVTNMMIECKGNASSILSKLDEIEKNLIVAVTRN